MRLNFYKLFTSMIFCLLLPSTTFAAAERRKWEPEEDAQLEELVKVHKNDWRAIAQLMDRRTGKQCRQRWQDHLDPKIVKGKLSDEEWARLIHLQKKLGNRWSEIAKIMPGRGRISSRMRGMLKCGKE